jgi:hypothetical protein
LFPAAARAYPRSPFCRTRMKRDGIDPPRSRRHRREQLSRRSDLASMDRDSSSVRRWSSAIARARQRVECFFPSVEPFQVPGNVEHVLHQTVVAEGDSNLQPDSRAYAVLAIEQKLHEPCQVKISETDMPTDTETTCVRTATRHRFRHLDDDAPIYTEIILLADPTRNAAHPIDPFSCDPEGRQQLEPIIMSGLRL